MRRRRFLTLAAASACWPIAVRGQTAGRPLLGLLGSTDPVGYANSVKALHEGLADHGLVDGRNLIVAYRWAMGRNDRLPALAAELIALNPDVIVTHGPAASIALKRLTATIPVVMAAIGDAIDFGVVSNLARPGGNFTGLSFVASELNAKRLELILELVPGSSRVCFLTNADNPTMIATMTPVMRQTAAALRVDLKIVGIKHPDEIEVALRELEPARDVLVVPDDALFLSHAQRIATLAMARRLVAIGSREFCQGGGLAGYGVDFPHLWNRAAAFVAKILKGTPAGALPIEQATKFELILNAQTAQRFGIKIPESLYVRADAIIE